jgi:transposase
MIEAAPQREHSLRELFNALRYVIRYGIAWRAMPNDFPPWAAVYQHVKNENLCSDCVRQAGVNLGVYEVALDHAAWVVIWCVTASMVGCMSSAIASVCM